jgi:iduronate 2-sulfatase
MTNEKNNLDLEPITMKYLSQLILLNLLFFGAFANSPENLTKPNVLFIAVDDLRPELSCFGASHMVTPNFDRLAKMGVRFSNAYCQQAVCAPSRNSLMTGLRPDALGVYDLYTFFRKKSPNVITLPQHFKNEGYHTEAMGKIYHTGHGNSDDQKSWSLPRWNMGEVTRKIEKIQKGDTLGLEHDFPTVKGKKLPWHCSMAPEKNMTDAIVADHAVQRLDDLKQKNKPFFLALGFIKPHLPFVAPKKYWDLYNPEEIKIPKDISAPEGCAKFVYRWSEMFAYTPAAFEYQDDDLTEVPIDQNTLHELTFGYYACVSFIDAQINLLLAELKNLGLDKNTVVVLWADHGWNLGEQHIIGKHTCYEFSSRVPLIILDPNNPNVGKTCSSLVELVDLFPTLSELCGLPVPPEYDGKSLVPLLEDVNASTKNYAFTAYRPFSRGVNMMLGTSVRSEGFRFTEWRDRQMNEVKEQELYKLNKKGNEKVNLVNQAKYNDLVSEYSGIVIDSLKSWKVIEYQK